MKKLANSIAVEVGKMFGGEGNESGGEVNPDAFDAGAQVW